jgi:phosphoribosylformylglycinamidine synthase
LALGLDELKVIRDHFNKLGRKPTDVELETLAQTWSEHCKHTIFADPMDELENGIYKTYIKGATEKIRKQKVKDKKSASARAKRDGLRIKDSIGDFCVSVFTDNAGGIIFDQDHIVCHKVETHNTPSALDPFGGSITGIVGVNRDVLGFGLGAKPIANFYGFCLAEPGDKTKLFRDKNLQQPMLSAGRILQGIVAGINAGGNQSGIPTPLGFLNFDARYRGKPLVFAGTLGLSPKKSAGVNPGKNRPNPEI